MRFGKGRCFCFSFLTISPEHAKYYGNVCHPHCQCHSSPPGSALKFYNPLGIPPSYDRQYGRHRRADYCLPVTGIAPCSVKYYNSVCIRSRAGRCVAVTDPKGRQHFLHLVCFEQQTPHYNGGRAGRAEHEAAILFHIKEKM